MKIVLESLKYVLDQENILIEKNHFLIGVSGGVDSMVLLHAMSTISKNVHVAHFNYNLRGECSSEDEHLVKSYCEKLNVPFHLKSIDFKAYLDHHGGNLQASARKQRMDFFSSVLEKHNLDFITLAHHHDDQIENILLHTLRGYGPKPMSIKTGKLLRPLLNIPKSEIHSYADHNKIPYRNDESNKTNAYDRNFLRNEIIPVLRDRFDFLDEKVLGFAERFVQDQSLLDHLIKPYNSEAKIDKASLYSSRMLYHLIKQYGFSNNESKEIWKDLDNVGVIYNSKSHKLLIDRAFIIIENDNEVQSIDINIESCDPQVISINSEYKLIIKRISDNYPETKTNVCLSIPSALFPLKIRTWKEGDRFNPKGMNGQSKKLKKLFQDHKIDRFSKKRVPILVDNNDDIIWIMGLQLDAKYANQPADDKAMLFSLI